MRTKGFTLIELMLVVAILGILLAIATPYYREYIARGYRADAKSGLLQNVQFLERYYTENNRYVTADGDPLPLPFKISTASGITIYKLGFKNDPTALNYVLQAEPVGSQSDDKCGTFTFNNFGQKGVIISDSASTDESLIGLCWNR